MTDFQIKNDTDLTLYASIYGSNRYRLDPGTTSQFENISTPGEQTSIFVTRFLDGEITDIWCLRNKYMRIFQVNGILEADNSSSGGGTLIPKFQCPPSSESPSLETNTSFFYLSLLILAAVLIYYILSTQKSRK